MRRLAVAASVALLASAMVAGPAASHDTMRWGWAKPLVNTFEYPSCVGRAAIWHQELGGSGITRLRAKFELRGQYDTTGIPWLTYADTGWLYSGVFPDNAQSYWTTWWPTLRYPYAHIYSGWGVLIGERPSFWQTDRKLSARLGEYACIADPGTL